MDRGTHTFDNGVRVYDDHLIPVQRERYRLRNVHEASEEDVFVALVRGLPHGARYLNVGCAIGYYPLLAKRLRPDLVVHAAEPLARHREYFLDNVRLNGFQPGAFTVHPEAVAATDGTAALLDQDYGSTLVREATPAARPGFWRRVFGARPAAAPPGTVRARTVTLDTLLAHTGTPVHLVQMDVQGFEADVLRGAAGALRAGHIGTFLIGTHGAAVHAECAALLAAAGYAIERSEPEARDQPDGILLAGRRAGAIAA